MPQATKKVIVRVSNAKMFAIIAGIVEWDNATVDNPTMLGNVAVWRDGADLIYSIPSDQWNKDTVVTCIAQRSLEFLC